MQLQFLLRSAGYFSRSSQKSHSPSPPFKQFLAQLSQTNVFTRKGISHTIILRLHRSYKHLYSYITIYLGTHFSPYHHLPRMAKKQSVAPSHSRTSRSSTASTTTSDPPTRGNRKPINATKSKTITKGQLNWIRFQSKTVFSLTICLISYRRKHFVQRIQT